MADPVSLVFEDSRPAETPGVHAVVIGVGHYRHFPGGEGEEFEGHDDMGQLSSPPHSARHVADWIFETWHDDAALPLRSVHLLLSEVGGPARYAHPLCPERTIKDATCANVEAALLDWFKRGDKAADNLLVFYFCGHGISSGTQHTLLCSDFGFNPLNPFQQAINFNDFHRGMDQCKARAQLFLVDACRVGSTALMETQSFKGQPIVPGLITFPEVARSAPIFRSSMPGTAAFGLAGKPSAFAQALPLAFKGGAWRLEQGRWVVCASLLVPAMDALIKRIMQQFKSLKERVVSDHAVTLTLKHPEGQPVVPVEIGCEPIEANEKALFGCQLNGAEHKSRPEPVRDDWLLDLEFGTYTFTATFAHGEFPNRATGNTIVFPPGVSSRIAVR